MTFIAKLGSFMISLAFICGGANAAVPVASYSFNNTLAANQAGKASLVSIDPLGTNSFETAVVNGLSQQVFRWTGVGSSPSTQGGLRLDATGLVAYDNYSVQLTFEFSEAAKFGGGWRRVIDTQNRQSDNGFYVAPGNQLQVYPVVTGSTIFTTPGFHDVLLTNFFVGGVREVKAYLDGSLQLTSNTDQLNLNNPNNPGHLLHFFVDNLASAAQQEWASGRIASLSLFDGVILPSDVPPTVPSMPAIPEPQTYALMLAGLAALGFAARKKQR